MVSDAKTSTAQLDLLMEALKSSIRKALDEDLLLSEAAEAKKLNRTSIGDVSDETLEEEPEV